MEDGMRNAKVKVMVALSGGVDSSVAAALLLRHGYDVSGATMLLSRSNERFTAKAEKAADDARTVAEFLGIPHYVLDFSDVFTEKVISYFIDEYIAGRTPNPCIACNRHIKFGALLRKAAAMGMDLAATGHYARICHDTAGIGNGRHLLKKSAAGRKDQTYVLYDMNQDQLMKVLMPLGAYDKEGVRRMAREFGLPVAENKESQEICFVDDDDYAGYISRNTGYVAEPGDFVDIAGNVLGMHEGIIHYTVGQRKGLGKTFGRPMYVIGIDAVGNKVVLGDGEKTYSTGLIAGQLNWISIAALEYDMVVTAKIRYNAAEVAAKISPVSDGMVSVAFDAPQRAITPGQSVVFYDGDIVVGGGIIDHATDI